MLCKHLFYRTLIAHINLRLLFIISNCKNVGFQFVYVTDVAFGERQEYYETLDKGTLLDFMLLQCFSVSSSIRKQIEEELSTKKARQPQYIVLVDPWDDNVATDSYPLDGLYKEEVTVGRGTYGDVCVYILDYDMILSYVQAKLQICGHLDQLENIPMERIYAAFNRAGFRSKIAVKKLRPQSESNEAEIISMKREKENLMKLHHENIVELCGSRLVHDDLAGQSLFLIMEACDGNLRKLCNPNSIRQLNELEIWLIIKQILNGLQFMHDHNIMHRDLKPENVLLNKCYHSTFADWDNVCIRLLQVKICDFGFSRLVSSASGVQSLSPMMGTLGYMAPEVFQGGDYHKKADIFSVGIITFELEHKRRPVDEEFEAIEDGHRISKFGLMGDQMLRMLQRDPENRPTASDVLRFCDEKYP